MPLKPAGAPGPAAAQGTFEVDTSVLMLSNTHQASWFTITNKSGKKVRFTLRRVRHIAYSDTGATYETITPLHWLRIGPKGDDDLQHERVIEVEGKDSEGNNGTKTILVDGARNPTLARWDGILEISNQELGVRQVNLAYSEKPDGRWVGKMYYFTSFDEAKISQWVAANRPPRNGFAPNAFIRQWIAFKYSGGHLKPDEWKAILTATQTGSWDWQATRSRCREAFPSDPNAACYLYDTGVAEYTADEHVNSIPGGVTEFRFVANLRTASNSNGLRMEGRIDSASTLQFPGNPSLTLSLERDGTACTRQVGGVCMLDITTVASTIQVGGRYLTTEADATCAHATSHGAQFAAVKVPWLARPDENAVPIYRYECRDTYLPFGDPKRNKDKNLALAAANPIPDSNTRTRKLELVDGAIFNSNTMFLIFKETYSSFVGNSPSDDFSAYGYLLLERTSRDLSDEDYLGSQVPDKFAVRPSRLAPTCSQSLRNKMGPSFTQITSTNASAAADLIIHGTKGEPATDEIVVWPTPTNGTRYVHYQCVTSVPEATTTPFGQTTVSKKTKSYFDHGPPPASGGGEGLVNGTCPAGSTLRYFLWDQPDQYVAGLACQRDGTCHELPNGAKVIRDPRWRCDAEHQNTWCDDRTEPRDGKQFLVPRSGTTFTAPFLSLDFAADEAYRYKSRFRSREGTGLGFAPEPCAAGSNALPYCYDAAQIDELGDRLSCLAYIFNAHYDKLAKPDELRDSLTVAFSWFPYGPGSGPPIRDGFERLNAELLIMLGDDAYTRAFSSRFDIAGGAGRSFEGVLFEPPDGTNLSGGAGYEMYRLHQAAQYYQMVLDRFYSMAPVLWASITASDPRRQFVRQETVVAYFDKLVRASTQKARAWSEIAKRYQNFNQPNLARRVVERAYASAYIESVVLSQLVLRLEKTVAFADRPQIADSLRKSAAGFRMALVDMQGVYDAITDTPGFLGLAPEYVPFPALDPGENSAFRVQLQLAQDKARNAATKEAEALADIRSYDSSSVAFQSELVRTRNSYESRLAEVCGTFRAEDGRTYAAIKKYAPLTSRAAASGDPCGLVGNGQITEWIAEVEIASLELRRIMQANENVLEEVEIERQRLNKLCNPKCNCTDPDCSGDPNCGVYYKLANYQWNQEGRLNTLEHEIRVTQTWLSRADRSLQQAAAFAQLIKCTIIVGTAAGGDCPSSAVASGIYAGAIAANEGFHIFGEDAVKKKQDEIADIERAAKKWQTEHQCDAAQVDSEARVATLLLQMKQLDLEGLQAEKKIGAALSHVEGLRLEAARLQDEQAEAEQMAINVEAARTDPNVRIYKNDTVLTADRTFREALLEAYRATRLFEYYASRTYQPKGKLYLIRMVTKGDPSLEAYLSELDNSFRQYMEQVGAPSNSVAVVSLRDDVFQIPRLGVGGKPLSLDERVAEFRSRLSKPELLDPNGWIRIPFATTANELSSATRNHKVRYVEAELVGSAVGDDLGFVYLDLVGTGVVVRMDGGKDYYVLPKRRAGLNPFFNGRKTYKDDFYSNLAFRDHPLLNSRWEVAFDRNDLKNRDVRLESLTDVKLYLHYSQYATF
ncbi:hypothetical protein [Corallococcus exercitus]|uniref:Uncharacterized protein n=1 Tax=Corallococcus exercitus TaxID=2316736 RepID=A0A7Y4JWZ5_9BACT|nr:hypothetical protein [Corallococcus exercitus]NOK11752.1 hypothetical protein [Corallococcus exercitus]